MTVRCTQCEKFYVATRHGPVVPGGKEREEVFCPHCDHVAYSEMTSQYFLVREATQSEIDLWLSANSKKGAN